LCMHVRLPHARSLSQAPAATVSFILCITMCLLQLEMLRRLSQVECLIT
jgi:hypothetical protein